MEAWTIAIIIVVILVVLLLLWIFWDSCVFSGSSDCFGRGCGTRGCCKKCGSSPCCCADAEICSITSNLIVAGDTSNPDTYNIIVEGAGLTSSSITSVVLNITGATDTATYTPTSTTNQITFTSTGYALSLVYVTADNVEASGTGPAVSGNMGAITHTLVGSVLTLTANIPAAP